MSLEKSQTCQLDRGETGPEQPEQRIPSKKLKDYADKDSDRAGSKDSQRHPLQSQTC